MQQLKWRRGETHNTERPADLEMGVQKVKVRKNITRTTRTTDEGKVKVWEYDFADMTPKQYDEYKEQLAQLDAPFAMMIKENNTATLEAIAAIYEAQIAGNENQIAIMEGIATIYEQGVTS